jgi:hypothetical protein
MLNLVKAATVVRMNHGFILMEGTDLNSSYFIDRPKNDGKYVISTISIIDSIKSNKIALF